MSENTHTPHGPMCICTACIVSHEPEDAARRVFARLLLGDNQIAAVLRAEYAAALEAAARWIEEPYHWQQGRNACADAIRALKRPAA